MNDLLHEYLGAVFHWCLVSLTQEGTQRLVPHVARVQISITSCNNVFHTLNRIGGSSCCVKVYLFWAWDRSNKLQNGFVRHKTNWETSIGQVELACDQLSTYLFNKALESLSKSCNDLLVCECKPSIFECIWRSKVIIHLDQFERSDLRYSDLGTYNTLIFRRRVLFNSVNYLVLINYLKNILTL